MTLGPRTPGLPGRAAALAVALALVVTLILLGCTGGSADPPDGSLVVFAAASLRDAAAAVASEYRAATGIAITLSTDSSATLRAQLEQGARADAFLSADTTNPEALASQGLVDGVIVPFAGNRLAIVVPHDNPAGIASPFDLGRPGVKIVAAGEAVPITGYANQLVERLAALPGAPAGFVAAYEANVVSREDNVRSALAKVELGEGDVAIVYSTDAAGPTAIASIDIPAEANVVATYAGAVPASATRPAAGHALLDWLVASDGRRILASFGFSPPA